MACFVKGNRIPDFYDVCGFLQYRSLVNVAPERWLFLNAAWCVPCWHSFRCAIAAIGWALWTAQICSYTFISVFQM